MGYAVELPDGVKEDVKRVDALIAKNAKAKEQEGQAPPPLPPKEEGKPIEPPVSTEKPLETPSEPAPTSEPAPAPPAEDMVPKKDLEKLQQEFSTLRGKYEKEPAELARQNSFLLDQLRALQAEVEALKVKPKEDPKPEKTLREVLTEHPSLKKLQESLAPEILDDWLAVQEATSNYLDEKIKKASEAAKRGIEEEVGKVNAGFAKSREEKFVEEVEGAYPDWKAIWVTPEFQKYIKEEDELSGMPRAAFIDNHFKRLDSKKVIKFFDIATGKASKQPEPKKEVVDDLNKEKLENRVGAPGSGHPSAKNTGTQVGLAEAKQALVALADKKKKGQFRGTQAEYDKESARLTSVILKLQKGESRAKS